MMRKIKLLIVVLCTGLLAQSQVQVKQLRCEMLQNPLGIDVVQPRFSWQLESKLRNVKQLSYQIIVSSSAALLAANNGDVWNSGVVKTDQSQLIRYAGKPLLSATTYYWKINVISNKGKATAPNPAFFSMGLLDKKDWKATWIGYDKASEWDSISQWSRLSARYLRKEFAASSPIKKATVFLAGLGMYELYINEKKIGDQVLAPNPTDYRASFFYNTHDVTSEVKAGKNAIGTVLGNGRFFTMRQQYKTHKHNNFGYPKLLLQLHIEYTNGTKQIIVSDASWKLQVDGPIRTNNEYDGEEYNALKEFGGWTTPGFNDNNWMNAEKVDPPPGAIKAQMAEPMKIMRSIKPLTFKKMPSGNLILDMGQNFSGWIQLLNIKGKAGQQIKLRFAESLQTNGELFTANLRDARVTDIYTLKGKGTETWEPSFVYHGFRYVEVSGFSGELNINNFLGKMVYDGIETTGSFTSSNSTLNSIYKNAWWGIASNYKGMPVDCPQRNERQPWLGDRTIGAMGESYLFDNARLYAKWMDDIAQSQTDAGAIPDVAPAFWNYYSDNVTWPAAFITISNHLYNQYGDIKSIDKHYSSMKKWMMYMKTKYLKDHILTKDKYGDWCVPPESLELIHAKDSSRLTDGQLIATAYYYKLLSYMQRFAKLTGNHNDVAAYTSLSDSIQMAFQKKYYDPALKQYDNNTATANLLPLYFGITPDSLRTVIFEKIRKKIHVDNHGHIPTGLIGTQWLMRGLTEYGYADMAYIMASNTSYPSWGYMVNNGATTIWELWNGNTANPGMNSQNHVMLLGDLLIWYYENLAGIRSDKNEVGFKKIIMKPVLPAGLDSVTASYKSIHGLISSSWKNNTAQFSWKIGIPANTTATVYIPANNAADITESGKPLSTIAGIKILRTENGAVVVELGSGNYSFVQHKKFKQGIVREGFIFERASFPESHAATIAETPDGLIAAWFGGTKEGNKDVCIYTSFYRNQQWSEPVKVADGIINDTLRYPCYNPVLYYAANGELLLFYKIGPNVAGWKGYMKRSSDKGLTWGERENLPDGFLGPIKNKPVFINNELVCPSSTEKNGWKVHFEITPDNGRTWRKTEPINDGKTITAIQPSLLTYADGKLQVLCRSKNRSIMQSWSLDRGLTWQPMSPAALPNNNSGTDALTLKDGRQVLLYNHVKPAISLPNGKGARTPLNVAVSKDGIQWSAALVVEDSPISQYSYPAVIQTNDGMLHIVYTWRREKIKHVVVDPSKLQMQPIVNEQWPGSIAQPLNASNDD